LPEEPLLPCEPLLPEEPVPPGEDPLSLDDPLDEPLPPLLSDELLPLDPVPPDDPLLPETPVSLLPLDDDPVPPVDVAPEPAASLPRVDELPVVTPPGLSLPVDVEPVVAPEPLSEPTLGAPELLLPEPPAWPHAGPASSVSEAATTIASLCLHISSPCPPHSGGSSPALTLITSSCRARALPEREQRGA
jgi:hypothetical protein